MSDERLPRNARDIIDRLGPAVTLRLIRALGGTTIPVPMRLTPVGEARYKKLCDMIGEDERDAALIRDRDAMARAGLSEREIVTGLALKYHLSDRHVWRVLHRVPEEKTSLFPLQRQGRLL